MDVSYDRCRSTANETGDGSFNTPLISVCMPCYNAAQFLPAALDSVLAQTYPHVEIICVDDGSTDDTAAVLAGYADRRGVRVLSERFGSAAKARNHAFAESRGDFIKFFDADDVLSPDLIARQVARLQDRPGCVAASDWVRFYGDAPADERPAVEYPRYDLPPVDYLLANAAAGDMTQCGMFLIPRELIEVAGEWDERLTLIDDTEFFARLLVAAGEVLYSGGTLFYRSGVEGTLSGRKTREAYASAALSAMLAVDAVLAAERTPRTLSYCADRLERVRLEIVPHEPALVTPLATRVAALGGAREKPIGGPVFHLAAKILGWERAARLRAAATRKGYSGARRRIINVLNPLLSVKSHCVRQRHQTTRPRKPL